MSHTPHYTIKPKNLGAHLIDVTITAAAQGETLTAKLPKWIAGSYKIRDYSRFVQCFQANTPAGEALNWRKLDSDTWQIETPSQGEVAIRYEVYAYDLSVRGSYLDDTRFFFNHCCVAFDIVEYSDMARTIDIYSVDDWRIFTALPLVEGEAHRYRADNYLHQIDCPVESASNYYHSEFALNDVRHEVVFTGHVDDNDDIDAMTAHIQRICQVEMRLFGGTPLDKYLFLNYIEPKQYGGLEHKNSVAQMASPDMLMKKGQALSERMIDFLGLCSHEYFHLWNVKRLQPKDFQPYDFYREQNTEMLWFFEGFTSYYDELFLLRAGVVNAETFLQRQAQNLSRVLAVPGRLVMPLASSSFDAWTKLYQADANSPNNMVSYYSKGAVFALYVDLFIRKHSDGKHSADDVMRHLWDHFGAKGVGIDEDDVFAVCAQFIPSEAHTALAETFVNGLHGTQDLPLDTLLSEFGVTYRANPPQTAHQGIQTHTSDSGMRLNEAGKIVFLNAQSHAAQVGVSVDDVVLAINHQQCQSANVHALLNQGRAGEERHLTLSRRGRVFEKTIQLAEVDHHRITFTLGQANHLSDGWLAVWREDEGSKIEGKS